MMKQRKARVIFSYSPQNSDELELVIDDIIDVIDVVEEGWWKGRLRGKVGVFPSNFVVIEQLTEDGVNSITSTKEITNLEGEDCTEGSIVSTKKKNKQNSENKSPDVDIIKPKQVLGVPTALRFGPIIKSALKAVEDKNKPPLASVSQFHNNPPLPPKPVREQAKVLFAYEAQNEDELSIREGDIITIISKEIEDKGWWKGELNNKVGVFPDNFVELIKPVMNNQLEIATLPPRSKKPDRTIEKTPPSQAQPMPSPTSSATVLSSSPKTNEIRNNATSKTQEDAMKCTPNAPLVSIKKPKLPTSPAKIPNNLNLNKPDLVPQDLVVKDTKEESREESSDIINSDECDINLGKLDPSNKLTHPTMNRVRGPRDRRPPSVISVPKENDNDESEKPEVKLVENKTNALNTETSKSNNKLPPWMLALKKSQAEKRKNDATNEDTTAKDNKVTTGTPTSPTKTSPMRYSGDFTLKFANKDQPNSLPVDIDSTLPQPVSILKHSKSTKSSTPTASTHTSPSQSVDTSKTPANMNTNPINSNSNNNSNNSSNPNNNNNNIATKLSPSESVNDANNEIIEILKEVKSLKETVPTRKEYEDLQKQVIELRNLVETQKHSYGSTVRELINEVAEVKKKLATLEIEVDRLRKLTTTV